MISPFTTTPLPTLAEVGGKGLSLMRKTRISRSFSCSDKDLILKIPIIVDKMCAKMSQPICFVLQFEYV